jgi:hypothetical protein
VLPMNSERNSLVSLHSQRAEKLQFSEMEIDLTQSDDEGEMSDRRRTSAVAGLTSSNSNLQSIDRVPSSMPPPLEPIDMSIPIRSK